MKRKLFIVLLCLLVAITSVIATSNILKQDIHVATCDEIAKIDTIGEVLALRIEIYLQEHKTCRVDDLIDINGIGKVRLRKIKRYYY